MNKLLLIVLACASAFAAPPARIKSLTCPAQITFGATGTCTITLTGKAPRKGASFRISVNSAALVVPSTIVTVPQGQTTATFPIKQVATPQPIASR